MITNKSDVNDALFSICWCVCGLAIVLGMNGKFVDAIWKCAPCCLVPKAVPQTPTSIMLQETCLVCSLDSVSILFGWKVCVAAGYQQQRGSPARIL
jgi:hypothetical protein